MAQTITPARAFTHEGWDTSDVNLRLAARRVEARAKSMVLYASRSDGANERLRLIQLIDELDRDPNPVYDRLVFDLGYEPLEK